MQQPAQRATSLDAFDKLVVRELIVWSDDTAPTVLARFQTTTASLKPDERIKLRVVHAHDSLGLLKAVLADPQASKVCSLDWQCDGEGDVDSVIPLLTSNCPELALLEVNFEHHSAFDFVSSMLEHFSSKIKVLRMPFSSKGDLPRLFAALGQSQVSALTLTSCYSPEFFQGLCDYLARDLLVRLKVRVDKTQLLSKVVMSLAKCTCIAELEMLWCDFSQPTAFTHLPKSITKLVLYDCKFVDGFDWSFLADSTMRELKLSFLDGVDGNQLGSALAVHLRAKGLDKLHLDNCDFVNATLAAVGVELGQIKILDIDGLNDASLELIALALQSPNCEMKKLVLWNNSPTTSSIENHLMPGLRHPNCNLASLVLFPRQTEHKAVEDRFYNRRALFALLQGQQVRRLYCPLRRLPVEMFRLVGKALISS